jgi:acyl transferase domain-containing protein
VTGTVVAPERSALEILDEVLDSTAATDVAVIAKEWSAKLTDTQKLADWERSASQAVGHRLGTRRNHYRNGARRAAEGARSKWSGNEGYGRIYLRFVNDLVVAGEIRKRRGDCTREDVLLIRGFRSQQAKDLAKEAKREQLLADAMEKFDAAVVADLPESVIVEVVRWQP